MDHHLDALAAVLASPPGHDLDALAAALTAHRPRWHQTPACRDQDTAMFFPEPGEPSGPAEAICATCPAQEPCLAWALDQGPSLAGIWAGTSPKTRRRLRADRDAA